MNPSAFRELVSGRRTGVAALLARGLLRMAEVPYSVAVRIRNRRFDSGRSAVHRVEVPVISVGNLTLGGTGKTPMVEWIARWLLQRDERVVLVSRGYGVRRSNPTESAAQNDEAKELAEKLPGVAHIQNPDRVAAAQQAIAEHRATVIVLDDGFQHRRLGRDLDIVLVDALEPFGFGHVFPRGTLREPLAGLGRAGVVILTRADMLDETQRQEIRSRIMQHCPSAIWAEVAHAPRELINHAGERQPLETLCGLRLAAFCGIGNPAGFRHTLSVCDFEADAFREFPDHYDFTTSDVRDLEVWAGQHNADAVVCTHKDLVKVGVNDLAGRPLWAVSIGMQVLSGETALQDRIAMAIEDRRSVD